jgi:hypothetical protein
MDSRFGLANSFCLGKAILKLQFNVVYSLAMVDVLQYFSLGALIFKWKVPFHLTSTKPLSFQLKMNFVMIPLST